MSDDASGTGDEGRSSCRHVESPPQSPEWRSSRRNANKAGHRDPAPFIPSVGLTMSASKTTD
jgi:hypothetical protein